MTTYQTTLQNGGSVRFGSGKIEIGTSSGDLQDLGVATKIAIKEEFTPVDLQPDNAVKIPKAIKDHTITLSFEMWEFDLEKLGILRGGIDTYGSQAATPVSITAEAHTLNDTTLVRLGHKNGDGTEVASITVTDVDDNAAVRNTDYVIVVDSAGYTCISRVSSSTVITDGDGVKVNYTYTPLASKTLSTGGLNDVSTRYARVTNINSAGKKFQIDIYAVKIKSGLDFTYPADDGDEPLKPKIELEGIYDTTRAQGDQLYKITDEQGV